MNNFPDNFMNMFSIYCKHLHVSSQMTSCKFHIVVNTAGSNNYDIVIILQGQISKKIKKTGNCFE